MAPLIVGLGYDWAIEQTAKCIKELVELIRPDAETDTLPPLTLSCTSPPMRWTTSPTTRSMSWSWTRRITTTSCMRS